MSDAARIEGQRAAAEYLRRLLLKPGRYREAWQGYVARPRDNVINQLAVAELLVDYLRSAPGRAGSGPVMAYQLRETVAGALSGGQLSQETLDLFINAFDFPEHESGRLRRLWGGATTIGVMSGTHALRMTVEQEVDAAIGKRRHQTLSLHDHIWVTQDSRIDRARTMQVIEANARGLDRIAFLCDTNVLTLEVGQGCKELNGPIRKVGDLFAAEILLARTLDLGETLTLEYWLSYCYPGDSSDPAERQYRRAVMRSVDNLDMRIEFHPSRLPAQVWWAHWDGIEGEILSQELVTLDSQHSAHRFLRSLDRTVVGFHWQWD